MVLVAAALAMSPVCWAAARPAALPSPQPDDVLHRVVPGDTLIGLSATYLDPAWGWRPLQRLNRVADPRRLQPGSMLRLPAAWLRAQAVVAEVLHVRGQVSVQRVAEAAQPLQAGASLRDGDLLRAEPESSLTLRFADGSRLLLRPDSELRITQLLRYAGPGAVHTRLRLDRGSADSRVPPVAGPAGVARRYELTTPSVHLGVRGTEFRTRVDAPTQTTRIEVIEGAVAAGQARQQQRLVAGQGGVAEPGAVGIAARPLAPAPDLSGITARLERIPLRVGWPAQPGVVAWRAQVYATGVDDALLLDGRFDEPTARWSDLPDGRYELRVRAIDAGGLEGLDARRAVVVKARPFPPFTTQPRAGALVRGDAVQLGWTRADGVASYRLQIARLAAADAAGVAAADPAGADFGAPLVDRSGLVDPRHQEPLPPGTYAWRMASVRADGDAGPFGDAQAFGLKPVPAAPPLQPPQLEADALVLRWPAGDAGQRYELQLARDRAFNEVLQTVSSAEPEAMLQRPGAGTYFVRVRTIDPDGFAGPYGGVQQIDIPRSPWWWLLPAGLLLLVL